MLAYITMPDKKSAQDLGSALVDAQLAAGVNLMGPALSIYRWRGKIRQKEEWLLIAFTHDFPGLEKYVAKVHDYEVPCVIGLSVTAGHKPFLDWVKNAGDSACGAPL